MQQKERIIWATALVILTGWIVVTKNATSPLEQPTEDYPTTHPKAGHRLSEGLPTGHSDTNARRSSGAKSSDRAIASLGSADPLTRMAGLLQALSTSDPAELQKLRQTFSSMMPNGRLLPSEEALLEYRAGQLEGSALLTDRTGTTEDFAQLETLRKQLEGWASTDPAAAGEWLEALPSGKYRDQMTISYLTAAARRDPASAVKLAASLHPSQQAAAGRETAIALAASATGDEVGAFLDAMPHSSGGRENDYLAAVFETLAGESSGISPQVIEEHMDQSYATPATLSKISHSRAKSDPLGTLEWAAKLEGKKDSLDRGQLLTAAVGGMTLDGLNHAEEWAAAHWGNEGVEAMWSAVMRNRELLENRGNDDNEYDKDD